VGLLFGAAVVFARGPTCAPLSDKLVEHSLHTRSWCTGSNKLHSITGSLPFPGKMDTNMMLMVARCAVTGGWWGPSACIKSAAVNYLPGCQHDLLTNPIAGRCHLP